MDECSIVNPHVDSSFDEVYEGMRGDAYWIRFFVRPCCPAPSIESAMNMLDRLTGEVRERDDFSDEQKQQLCALVDERRSWYPKSGLVRASAK